MKLKILMATQAKASGTNPKPFSFIYGLFPKAKIHNMSAMMLNPRYKG
jgi:hypothetical protein